MINLADELARLEKMLPPPPHDTMFLTEAMRAKIIAKVDVTIYNPLYPSRLGEMEMRAHPPGSVLRNKKTGDTLGVIEEGVAFAGYGRDIEVIEPTTCVHCNRHITHGHLAGVGFIAACGRRLVILAECGQTPACRNDEHGGVVFP